MQSIIASKAFEKVQYPVDEDYLYNVNAIEQKIGLHHVL